MTFSHIAIPTQNLNVVRISEFLNFAIKPVTAYFGAKQLQSVLVSSTVDMIESEKLWFCLATASTFVSIVGKNLFSDLISPSLIGCTSLIRIIYCPLPSDFGMMCFLLWCSLCPSFCLILLTSLAMDLSIYGWMFATTHTNPLGLAFMVLIPPGLSHLGVGYVATVLTNSSARNQRTLSTVGTNPTVFEFVIIRLIHVCIIHWKNQTVKLRKEYGGFLPGPRAGVSTADIS